MKPDLIAKTFSTQNAFFFAVLSKIAYETEDEARRLLVGSPACSGLGFDQLHWFEVRNSSQVTMCPFLWRVVT